MLIQIIMLNPTAHGSRLRFHVRCALGWDIRSFYHPVCPQYRHLPSRWPFSKLFLVQCCGLDSHRGGHCSTGAEGFCDHWYRSRRVYHSWPTRIGWRCLLVQFFVVVGVTWTIQRLCCADVAFAAELGRDAANRRRCMALCTATVENRAEVCFSLYSQKWLCFLCKVDGEMLLIEAVREGYFA